MGARRLRWIIAGCIAALGVPREASAAPAMAEQCATASEQAQLLRLQGHLVAARAELVTCSAPACPTVVWRDCDRWLGEVDDALPSVVVIVRNGAGADVLDARVTIDGRPTGLDRVEAHALPLDPGPHDFAVVGRDGATAKGAIVLREGEKRRTVELLLGKAPPPVAPTPRPTPVLVTTESSTRTVGWTFVLAGSVFAAAGIFFGIRQHVLYQDARDTCGRTCGPDIADDIDKNRLFEGIGFGMGALALAAGLVLLVTHPKQVQF